MPSIPVNQKDVTFEDIQKNFPLEGSYIFRFKFLHGKKLVWLDLQKKKDKIPTFEGNIFMKATRISWGATANAETIFDPQPFS